MNELIKKSVGNFIIKSKNNDTDFDESLLSLKFMKEIDLFLSNKNLAQKIFAKKIGVSAAYVSQLMTGMKKVNVSFLNKIEQEFNVEFNVEFEF